MRRTPATPSTAPATPKHFVAGCARRAASRPAETERASPDWRYHRCERCFEEVRDDLWTVLSLPGPTPQRGGFWPRRGPVWDGVALVPGHRGDGVVLVEAKSHAGELKSGGTRATESSGGPVA